MADSRESALAPSDATLAAVQDQDLWLNPETDKRSHLSLREVRKNHLNHLPAPRRVASFHGDKVVPVISPEKGDRYVPSPLGGGLSGPRTSDESRRGHIDHTSDAENIGPGIDTTEMSNQDALEAESDKPHSDHRHETVRFNDDSVLPSMASYRDPSGRDNSELGIDNSGLGMDSQADWSRMSSSALIERDMEKLLDMETSIHRPDSSFVATPTDHQLPEGSDPTRPLDEDRHIPTIRHEHVVDNVETGVEDRTERDDEAGVQAEAESTTPAGPPRALPSDQLSVQDWNSMPRAAPRTPSVSSVRPSRSGVPSSQRSQVGVGPIHQSSRSSLGSPQTTDSTELPELPQSSTLTAHSNAPTGSIRPGEPTTPRPLSALRGSGRRDSGGPDAPGSVASRIRDNDQRSSSAVRIKSISSVPGTVSRHTLTLKEQNITIDKLTKENFDLKLKIHFLDQALQRRSDEGLGELVQENVQLQTDLANERKESVTLRKRAREAERRARILDEELNDLKVAASQSRQTDTEETDQLRDEVSHLRVQIEQSEMTIHRLRSEMLEKEVEKRRMAEVVRMIQTADSASRDRDGKGVEEAMEMWKDLLAAETARREQADEDTSRLRAEVSRLQAELRRGDVDVSSSLDRPSTVASSAHTLVEKLQHENAELRRDLGAQTSMLTSRNRERERLQAEIEDLKLASRRVVDGVGGGRSIAGDSIFERSVSRAGPIGRGSHASGPSGLMSELEQDRDELEHRLAGLRDEVAQTKLLNHELERELNGHLDLLQRAEKENETMVQQLGELDGQLTAVVRERDDLLAALAERDEATERLQAEAVETVERLEDDCRAREADIDRLAAELQQKTEDFEALQAEMAEITESVLALEDERASSRARIQSLDAELDAANSELETLDKRVRDLTTKSDRLEVQLESHQAEIGFLREEQEADKIKIGGLEAGLTAANSALEDEKERVRQADEQRREEAKQRAAIDSQEKADIEQAFSELNDHLAEARAEAGQLKKDLSDTDADRAGWKDKLEGLEIGIKAVFAGSSSPEDRVGLIADVATIQDALADARDTITQLRASLNERDLMIRDRDDIVERAGLDLQTGTAALEREKRSLQQARIRVDQLQAQNHNYSDTIKSYESRVRKLESGQRRDKDQIAALESQLQSKYTSQTTLLLNLWHRLSSLCGTDWAQKNCLIDGQALPTVESINKNLPGFSKNILLAIKTIEGMVKGFRERLKTIERDLWKDYQTLEHAIDARTQKLDKLELAVSHLQFLPQPVRQAGLAPPTRSSGPTSTSPGGANQAAGPNSSAEAALRRENLMLHARLAELQQQSQQHNSSPDFRSTRNTQSGSGPGTGSSRIPTSRHPSSSSASAGGPTSGPGRGRHTNNPSYSSGSPLSFDPTSTVPGHQSRPSIDYTSTSHPPQAPLPSGGSGGGTAPGIGLGLASGIGSAPQGHYATSEPNYNGNNATTGGGPDGMNPTGTSTAVVPTSTTSTAGPMSTTTTNTAAPSVTSVGTGMSQSELARAALCHEFLQQAKDERGLRAMERSNARRRLLEKEGP